MPPKAAAVEYVAIRELYQTDPRTGRLTFYKGDGTELYTGPLDKPYLLDPSGPDGKGPLIAEKSTPAAASGDANEEK